MIFIKQSTVVTFLLGPFLDKDDGVVPETGLATNMDNAATGIRVSKNGAVQIDRNSATAPAHDDDGYYRVGLSATDTNTLGFMKVQYEESGVTLPAWEDFMVMPANVFDSFFGADNLQIDQTQIAGTTVPTPNTAGIPDVNVQEILDIAVSLTGGDLDVNVIGGVAPLGTVMRGTDGVDTAIMRGTNSALLASSAPTNFGDLAITVTTGRVDINVNNDKTGYSVSALSTNVITAASINAAALNGKGDWNIGKTGYTLTQTFPTNFADFSITATSGLVTLAAVTHTGAIIPTTTAVTNAVTVGTINANVITASSINANAITSAKIAANAIGASQMATGAIATGVIDSTARDEIADSHLNRDMSAVTVTNTRSPINCLRFLRNKWSIAASVLTVTEEDDTTTAWTSTLVGTAGADPITSSDPT